MSRKRNSKFREEYCEDLLQMASEGKTEAHFRFRKGITKAEFDKWIVEHPQFRDAVDIAKSGREAWWEVKGTQAAFNEIPVNAQVFNNMVNRALGHPTSGASSQNNIQINIGQSKIDALTDEQRRARIAELYSKGQDLINVNNNNNSGIIDIRLDQGETIDTASEAEYDNSSGTEQSKVVTIGDGSEFQLGDGSVDELGQVD